jgi:hypothetical protein
VRPTLCGSYLIRIHRLALAGAQHETYLCDRGCSITLAPLVSLPAVAAAGPDNCYEVPGNVSLYNTEGFYADLEKQGIQSDATSEIRSATLNMDARSVMHTRTLRATTKLVRCCSTTGTSIHDAASWSVASVDNLCPQYRGLLGT